MKDAWSLLRPGRSSRSLGAMVKNGTYALPQVPMYRITPRDGARLGTGIVAARRVGGRVVDDSRARIVVTANDHQSIRILSGQPGDHVKGWRVRAVRVNEWVESYLKPGNGTVLAEKKVAGS